MLKSPIYQERLFGLVTDEAHVVPKWGKGNVKEKTAAFRESFFRLGEVRSLLPAKCPVLALTATATTEVKRDTIQGLSMKPDTFTITVSPDRPNIYLYKKKVDKTLACFQWLIDDLKSKDIKTPRTIVYCKSQKQCGKLFRHFKYELGQSVYFPNGAKEVCSNSMIAMYHANTLPKHKEITASSLFDANGTCRVVFATTALGMGVNLKDVRYVIHYGPPRQIDDFVQEMGRAGRDSLPAKSLLFFTGGHLKKCSQSIKEYATTAVRCLREILLHDFGESVDRDQQIKHDCCQICHLNCTCKNVKCDVHIPKYVDVQSHKPSRQKRKVTRVQKEELQELLTDHKKQLELNCPGYVLSSEATTGFTDSLMKSVVKNSKNIFTLEDVIELTPVFSKSQAVTILHMVRDVFEDFTIDLDMECFEQEDIVNIDIDYMFGDLYESEQSDSGSDSAASGMSELSGVMELPD